ncbi:hypothetical protein EGR_06428 [Echinococcus granulosus]|uniref:Uncharacterized protein n=1 Tax=Echinococcus granulosus TaxID=6210 RepID=W6UKY6_ECHGR|nr:hypothetical protein EGR_06428 [Echinococcus granulosus]EUB58757.1 hypothetical protein EGR_06428 [Echinococcus granulosus]
MYLSHYFINHNTFQYFADFSHNEIFTPPRRLNDHHVQCPVSSAPHDDDSTRSTEKLRVLLRNISVDPRLQPLNPFPSRALRFFYAAFT